MTLPPPESNRSVAAAFDAIAADYDGLRHVRRCSRRLLEIAPPPEGGRVLDVGTGTGEVALAAALAVGPAGRAIGLDLSPVMLELARGKLARAGVTNAEFVLGDAQRLDLPDASVDAVYCASVLFFVPDMAAAVREWRRVLVPGGRAAFSCFGPDFLQPGRALWSAALDRFGLSVPPLPDRRLADPDTCRALLTEAGFAEVEVRTEQLGYPLDPEAWWRESRDGLIGLPLTELAPEERARFEAEHLAEVRALAGDDGVWVDVGAHFATGVRPPDETRFTSH